MIALPEHPLLDVHVFAARFPSGLGDSPNWLVDGLRIDASAPMSSSDEIRAAVRDLLRWGGFKPTGRSKPASEYLVRAATEGALAPINALVDGCNVVSLHSGLPISVVDRERAVGPLSILVAPHGASYVFNASGQTIDLGGLLCLADAEGPCANAVKDAQRTKTTAATREAVAVVWGTRALPGRAAAAARWYAEVCERLGAEVSVGQLG
ncbi:MAG: hypothetical protein FJ090_14860 [Deltaproteobacteria bacterium]|nr:hypothetical protein [Deltaproteobacteria bacterium]